MNIKISKINFAVFLFCLIIPNLAFASWWNPLSWSMWNIFRPTPHVQQVQIATTTIPTAITTTTEKVDAKVVSTKKLVVDSTQKVSQPNIKQPSVAVPSQPISTLAPSCTQDTWSCSDWLACSSSGSQTRSCSKTFECPSVVTQSPITSQSCTPPAPSCQADTWSCGDWSLCSVSGNQTRSCTKTFDCSSVNTPSPARTQSCTPPEPIQQTPTYVMPDKPIIESFCDNKGNCVHSYFAESWASSSPSPYPTVHVGETLNFTIKVSGEETSGVLAFILPQEYDWVKEGGMKPWSTDLTYTKTFTNEDISTRYFMYAYIKSSNDNYHRRSSGCNWTAYSCDDNAQIIYTVLP
jgi:hypothetical protein